MLDSIHNHSPEHQARLLARGQKLLDLARAIERTGVEWGTACHLASERLDAQESGWDPATLDAFAAAVVDKLVSRGIDAKQAATLVQEARDTFTGADTAAAEKPLATMVRQAGPGRTPCGAGVVAGVGCKPGCSNAKASELAREVERCAGRNVTEKAMNLVRSRPGGKQLSHEDAHGEACRLVAQLRG